MNGDDLTLRLSTASIIPTFFFNRTLKSQQSPVRSDLHLRFCLTVERTKRTRPANLLLGVDILTAGDEILAGTFDYIIEERREGGRLNCKDKDKNR